MRHDAGRDYLLFCDETGGSREGNVMRSIFLILLHLLSPNLIPFRVTGSFDAYRMPGGGSHLDHARARRNSSLEQ